MIYPKMYFCRGGVSDKSFILARMAVIPENIQQKVSDEYERIYGREKLTTTARKKANTYLHEKAKEYL